jgi:membrane protein DedA with SNARE-associated domain
VGELVARFGLLAVFFGTAVEGDLALILGGVAAHVGVLDPIAVGVAGALGGFAGDAAWYLVGRRNADVLRRSAVYRRVGPTIERLAGRFGPYQILFARPVYGTRVASMLFWGTERIAFVRFAALDLPACTVWAVLLVSLGYFSSGGVAAIVGKVRRAEELIAGAIVLAVVAALTVHALSRRWARRLRE